MRSVRSGGAGKSARSWQRKDGGPGALRIVAQQLRATGCGGARDPGVAGGGQDSSGIC